MAELVATDDRQSLEGRGLLRADLGREPGWRLPAGLAALGLSEQESWDLLGELVRSLRQQGAITMPDDVDPRDEHFDPRRGPIYVRAEAAEPKRKVLSWLPTRGMNRRLDYVTRVLKATGSPADPREVLQGCWRFLEGQRDGWLATTHDGRLGVVRQVDHTWLKLAPVGPDDVMYRCRAMPPPGLGIGPGCLHDHRLWRDAGQVRRPCRGGRRGSLPVPVPVAQSGPAQCERAHRPADQYRGRRHPAALHPGGDQRPVLLDHVRAGRGRR